MVIKINASQQRVSASVLLKKIHNKAFAKAVKDFQKKGSVLTKKLVLDSIESGMSPVKGKGEYGKYSDSYKKQIRGGKYPGKKIRPINLKLTGDMLKSLKLKLRKTGFTLFFSDPKADYHNNIGAGKSRVIRRMLPKKGTGETLKRTITKPIRDLANRLLKKYF